MSENLPATQEAHSIAKIDNGKPALYNPAAFDQIWRAAKLFASSDLVPTAYRNKPENCFIAIEMADRMGISPFAMLQSLVIIQGKPSMEAKLIIALVNDSGIFADPLEYEIVGADPYAQDYKVRAFAKMKKTGKDCLGPWITYQMVKGEGWLDKGGSKWKTMPSIMFMYRAASFFAKVYCPNITMGMQTREEMEDVRLINITPKPEAPALVEAPDEPAPPVVAPPLAPPITETVDMTTGEITTATPPAVKKKSPGRPAKQPEAPAPTSTVAPYIIKDDSDRPPPPGELKDSPLEEVEEVGKVEADEESEAMGDLF